MIVLAVASAMAMLLILNGSRFEPHMVAETLFQARVGPASGAFSVLVCLNRYRRLD
jgi:hypothetical protein